MGKNKNDLCTKNSVERTQSYIRIPAWPEIRDSWHLSRTVLCSISFMMSSYPLERTSWWPHVAMVVVLVCSHFPSLRYMLISRMMSSCSIFLDDVLYILLYRFALNMFPSWKRWFELKLLRAGHRTKGSTPSERRKGKHALVWYGRDCRRGIWHGLPAVLQTLDHDSGDVKQGSVVTMHIYVLLCIVDNAGRHGIESGREGIIWLEFFQSS